MAVSCTIGFIHLIKKIDHMTTKYLLVRTATVCSIAVANSFNSDKFKLFSATYLGLYLARV